MRELFYYLKNEMLRKTSEAGIEGRKGKHDFKIGIVMGLYERKQGIGKSELGRLFSVNRMAVDKFMKDNGIK